MKEFIQIIKTIILKTGKEYTFSIVMEQGIKEVENNLLTIKEINCILEDIILLLKY